MKSWKLIGTALLAATLSGIGPASAQKTEDVTIVVFGPPSLGAFLPPIIKSQKFDTKNGLNITFQQRPPDAYLVQFNTGEFQIGGSAALLNVGQAATKGVDVQY